MMDVKFFLSFRNSTAIHLLLLDASSDDDADGTASIISYYAAAAAAVLMVHRADEDDGIYEIVAHQHARSNKQFTYIIVHLYMYIIDHLSCM